MSDQWLRRAPWAIKMLVFFAAIFVTNAILVLLFQHPLASVANESVARFFVVMWLVFTAPYYVGWVARRLIQQQRRHE